MKSAFGNFYTETGAHVVDTLFQAVRRDNDMIEIIHPAMVDYNATG